MKIFYDYKTKRNLEVLLRTLPREVTRVYAAVAYSQSDLLLEKCISNKTQLEWWGLFDSGISTSLDLIKRAIESDFVKFYPFAKFFHPKVIYFENFGLYIGSANMTKNALSYNVEAGVFIPESDMDEEKRNETMEFFDYLRKSSILATKDDIENIENFTKLVGDENKKIEKINLGIENNFKERFKHLFLLKPGATDFGKNAYSKEDEQKTSFLQEWRETQNYLDVVNKIMASKCKQPEWVAKNGHPTIITDQLLHAYYYTYILKGDDEGGKSIEKVNESYEKNKSNPARAIDEAISWWETLIEAPNSENVHINEWGLSNLDILSKLKTQNLSYEDFSMVIRQNHAARNHARQISNKFFDLPSDFKTDVEKRVEIFSKWLYQQKTSTGLDMNEVLRFILFEDKIRLEERIYRAINDKKYRIEHFGKSIIGELIGWGRPDITHIRNNRVNKALRCLGYDVRLFSE
jgi:hypothetical protein